MTDHVVGRDCELGAIHAFLDRPADPEQLRHLSGRGSAALETDDLVRLARRLDVQARKVTVSAGKLDSFPLPAIARMRSGEHLTLLKVSMDEALVFRLVFPPGTPRINPSDKGALGAALLAGHYELGVLIRTA